MEEILKQLKKHKKNKNYSKQVRHLLKDLISDFKKKDPLSKNKRKYNYCTEEYEDWHNELVDILCQCGFSEVTTIINHISNSLNIELQLKPKKEVS